MADKKGGGGGDNQTNISSPPTGNAEDKAKDMCCEDFLSQEDLTVGKIAEEVEGAEENVSSSDEVDEELESEYYKLNDVLDLPEDTYSLTRISPVLPACVKYGMRSGTTHFNMSKFSPLSRGLQGSACAIAAFTTNAVLKSRCWNELVIDQIIDDGDSYYSESYKDVETDDRRTMTVRDLKRDISVQKTHYVYFDIDDAAYAGTFRSENPKEMHLVKAIDLFFKRYDAGLLISSKLNISIWKDSKFYNIFDGQARGDDCLPVKGEDGGSAKLMLVRDLTGVVFIILEKSNVVNEPFVLFPIAVINANRIPSHPDDPEEPFKSIGEPKRRPSGYKIQEQFRALVQGTYHIMHPQVPAILQGRGHLMIAVATLIYSRLINANKWSSVIIDLIFNQAHIYMIDLLRALEKKLDDSFELKIDELMGDVILGVYFAKINVTVNVVPGQKKKGKSTIDAGIREFFQQNQSGILEMKKYFFAIWKEGNKYYFLDPFGCDDEGFRIDPNDPEDAQRYKASKPCVTMNSSVNQLVETILYNTGSKDKDPFIIHALRVLYVKTGTVPGDPIDNVIYREKRTNRRPLLQGLNDAEKNGGDDEECKFDIEMVPKPRPDAEKTKDQDTQFPELMINAVDYMMKEDEPTSFIVKRPSIELFEYSSTETSEEFEEPDSMKPEVQYVSGYRVVNAHRLLLQGEINCFAKHYKESVRGRQGLVIAITAMSYGKLKPPSVWRNIDIDQVLDVGNTAYNNTIEWIQRGSPAEMESKEKGGGDKGDEEGEDEDEEDEENEEGEEDEDEEGGVVKRELKRPLKPAPSHLDVTLLPDKIRLVENEVSFKRKINFAEGDANPLANLGEALEHYFERYDELVVENKKLMFGIWKDDGKYFLFNPYGSDKEGRRLRGYPAALIVTDTINELTDAFYGILEYNDSKFNFHYIGIQSIQPNDKYSAPELIEIPEEDPPEKYNTVFLPVTDEDLFVPEPEPEIEELETMKPEKIKKLKGDDEEEDEEADNEEGEEGEDEDEKEEEMRGEPPPLEPEKPLTDPLLEIEEQEQPDAPDELNLSLLSGTVIVDEEEEKKKEEMNEALTYEKLKYEHPPPYVLPPKKVLCVLLEAKKASKSAHSLLSRFSIDSMLSIKKESGLPAGVPTQQPIISAVNIADGDRVSKLIKLPPKKYFVSRLPPTGFTPIRAIDDKYLQDEDLDRAKEEECRKGKVKEVPKVLDMEDVPEIPTTVRIKPSLIPLGPPIKTPTPKKKPKPCMENKKKSCEISAVHKEDPVLEKIMCKTEDLLLDLMFPDPDPDIQNKETVTNKKERCKEKKRRGMSQVRMKDPNEKPASPPLPERCGFKMTEEEVGVINGNMCLENRETIEECHFKQCYFAAILCVLAKIRMDVNIFRGSILDQFILVGDKIYQRTGKLRYKALRWFYNVEILETKYNIILRQIVYADPENCSEEELPSVISNYLEKNQSGILVFPSGCYAFWYGREKYYLFDPYGCDEDGHASTDGFACLMEFPDLQSMIDRIRDNTGEISDKVFRIHAIAIAHMEPIKHRKKKRNKKKIVPIKDEPTKQEPPPEPEPVLSLIELSDWVTKSKSDKVVFDMTISGFAAVPNFNASTLEVVVLENDVTDQIRTEFKKKKNVQNKKASTGGTESTLADLVRKKPHDVKFKEHGYILEAIDLCIMAWACIHDPTLWGTKTIKGICDASKDLTHDCILASEDTTVSGMTDGVLPEFTIANYNFRATFAPLHQGTLYEITGWNLAMSLKKILNTEIYSGAVIICGKAHIGVMKKKENHYAWWVIPKTKKLKVITSEEMEDFLKLIVKEINEPKEIEFLIRAVTISYARKMAPDCEDTAGLHERAVPATSLAEIHRKPLPPYDIEAIFRKTVPESRPIFVQGTVAVKNRDLLKEPRVKRCYFVAVLAIMVKRDIVQSPVAGTIDKLIEVAEGLYKEFDEPKYHTEHILKNVTIMNRIFDFRDCASPLIEFQSNSTSKRNDNYSQMKKYLKRHFKKHSDGIIHFTNCCYGFWYSRSTNSYYYLDPYQCDAKGKKVSIEGSSCLCIFPSLCLMARHMYQNRFEDCTGFFIHRMHVESINVPPFKKLQEDPMWVYLDFHWSFGHAPDITKSGKKKKQTKTDQEKPSWNYYAIEVPNLIYSVWGTLGCYDPRFGQRVGKNQAGISVAILAMQFLCHPSRWGPAILDSAVICGDCYHTESLRSAVRSGCRHPNRFNLQSTFKVFPHIWTIEFKENMCGILYGGRDRPTLAATLKLAFEEAPNVIIECNKATFSVLTAEDGYYVADPRWTGPPLFTRNHGALYVLRCRNMNALIYALTKMLNTNQRLEFHITPVLLTFAQESCRLGGEKAMSKTQKQILLDPICRSPTRSSGPISQIPGAITTPDEDSYLVYRRNLREGMRRGVELENPSIRSPEPKLPEINMNNTLVSTMWHLNVGHPMAHRHSRKRLESRYGKGGFGSTSIDTEYQKPLLHEAYEDYPRLVDFTVDTSVQPTADDNETFDYDVNPNPLTETEVVVPPLCAGTPSFIEDVSRGEFAKTVKEMADVYFKKYKHRVPEELEAEKQVKKDVKKKKKKVRIQQEEEINDQTEGEAVATDLE